MQWLSTELKIRFWVWLKFYWPSVQFDTIVIIFWVVVVENGL